MKKTLSIFLLLLTTLSFSQTVSVKKGVRPVPTFTISDAEVSEGEGTVTFTVTKRRSNGLPSELTYTTQDGTAVAGSDYTATSGTLTFLSNEYTKTITVSISDDSDEEAKESFTVKLTGVSNYYLSAATGTCDILDNDEAVPPPTDPDLPFSTFTVPTGGRYVSAGIYDGKRLIKTLFEEVWYDAGTHPIYWNGTNRNGIYDSVGKIARVSMHDIQVRWEGTIGNSSADTNTLIFGSRTHMGYYSVAGAIAQVGGKVWYAVNYAEAMGPIAYFDTAAPNIKKLPQMTDNTYMEGYAADGKTQNWLNAEHLATDGQRVYFTGFVNNYAVRDQRPDYYISALYAFDNTTARIVQFGSSHTTFYNPTVRSSYYPAGSLIDVRIGSVMTDSTLQPTGIAVQTGGNFLFYSCAGRNEISVLDKRNRSLIRRFQTLTRPEAMVWEAGGTNGYLWVIHSFTKVEKFTVNSDGTLTTTGISLTLSEPNSLAVANGKLYVTEEATHQVLTFNTSTGASDWTFGQPGGYETAVTVSDDRFLFSQRNGNKAAIYANSDGSFWLCDVGTNRVLKYDASRNRQKVIYWQGASYEVFTVQGDSSRVFLDGLEFSIDYTKPINQCWTLVRNYNALIGNNAFLGGLVKMSNGKVYGRLGGTGVVEITNTGIRATNVSVAGSPLFLPNGDLLNIQGNLLKKGSRNYITQRRLTGFSGDNPVWAEPEIVGTTPVITVDDPATGHAPTPFNPQFPYVLRGTDTLIALFDAKGIDPSEPGWHKGYHLAAIQKGSIGDDWEFLSAPSTYKEYKGIYPTAFFDIGNSSNAFTGSEVKAMDSLLIWGHHGEGWKATQTNMYHIVLSNGLQLKQFGSSQAKAEYGPTLVKAYPERAGNALMFQLVKVGDTTYLYHGDESFHSGLHRWKMWDFNTITTQVIPAKVYDSIPTYTDLMAGVGRLRIQDTLADGNGWTRTPSYDTEGFQAKTSYYAYDAVDIWATNKDVVNVNGYKRDLGTISSADWRIEGTVQLGGNPVEFARGVLIEVLDVNNRVIARWKPYTDWSGLKTYARAEGNGTLIHEWAYNVFNLYFLRPQPISFSAADGYVSVSYGGYTASGLNVVDPLADWTQPKTLWVRFHDSRHPTRAPRYDCNIGTWGWKLFATPGVFTTSAARFVSSGGSNSNPGTLGRPYQSLSKAVASLQRKDTIYLRRGDTFYGDSTLYFAPSRDSVVFAAFGTGEAPVWTGLRTIPSGSLVNEGGGVYSYTNSASPAAINVVELDGEMQIKGRWPRTGYHTITAHSGTAIGNITGTGFLPGNFAGGEIVVRLNDYVIGKATISSRVGDTFHYRPGKRQTAFNYEPQNNFGFFVQDHPSLLSEYGDWAYDSTAKKLYVYYGAERPANHTLKVSFLTKAIMPDATNVTFRDIHFTGWNEEPIFGTKNGLKLRNMEFSNSGSAVVYTIDKLSYLMDSSYVHDMQRGMLCINSSGTGCTDWTITNSTFERIGIHPGLLASTMIPSAAGAGARLTATHNTMDSIGYAAVSFGGQSNISYNVARNTMFTLADGGAFYTYTGGSFRRNNRLSTLQNNIIINCVGNTEGTYSSTTNPRAMAIYLDERADSVDILNNTIINAGRGIFFHNAYDVRVRGNVLYNTTWGVSLTSFDTSTNPAVSSGKSTGLYVRENSIVATESLLRNGTRYGDATYMLSDSNRYYASDVAAQLFHTSFGSTVGRTFTDWKAAYGQDAASTLVSSTGSQIVYNTTGQTVVQALVGSWQDESGNVYSGTISIPAYSSKLLFPVLP